MAYSDYVHFSESYAHTNTNSISYAMVREHDAL